MKIIPAVPSAAEHSGGTRLEGLLWVDLDVFKDERGFFVERFHAEKYRSLGLGVDFVQDNHSRSAPRVLRGLHFQRGPAQGKLVAALTGRIFDVVADLRKGSPTYGKWFSQELGDDVKPGRMLWVPAGFAHGFCVLGEAPADVVYKVDAHFHAASDSGVRFNDPALAVTWPIDSPLVSSKDLQLPLLSETAPLET